MWMIKMVLQAFALFIVPVLALTFYNTITSNSKATGLAAVQAYYGPFFALVGLFYVAFGVFLWSPLPGRLLMGLVEHSK